MMRDPHFQARGLFENVDVNGRPLKVPAIVPMLSETPGATDWAGPEIGAHNEEILCGRLGLSQAELEQLRGKRII
jgi:crotonobetainyl-CoA:carnitine CoA-transferase CaiB-like acyl-CoA transferase